MRHVVRRREKGDISFTLKIDEFTLEPGKIYAVVGDSGCGKSTFLDLLSLVLQPSSAEMFRLELKDQAYDLLTATEREKTDFRKRHIGYVLQSGGLLPFLTVFENMSLTCQLNGMGAKSHVKRLAKFLHIEDQLKKKPQHLSGGQRQRVAIGRALAHRPKIILADEPTAAVDKRTAIEIRDEFVRIAREIQAAVVIVTHDLSLVEDIADVFVTFSIERSGKNKQQIISIAETLSRESYFQRLGRMR